MQYDPGYHDRVRQAAKIRVMRTWLTERAIREAITQTQRTDSTKVASKLS